ncbi:beta strand repeat-containing protein [Lacipirellula sp.]|uniref:beta strand repeat-containing protein n=1 Tax=Lacipirellula sp. TaxID=2691419 RepID=UPI003D10A274
MNRTVIRSLVLIVALAGRTASAQLVNNEWNAGSGNWNVQSNWFPFGVPDNGAEGFDYNVLIGNRAVAANAVVTFVPRDGVSDTVTSFALSDGADFLTNGNRLIVLGQATVDGVGSTLRVDPNAAPGAISFQANNLLLKNSATMTMNGGTVYAATIDVGPNARVQGGGLIIFGDADTSAEDAFDNSGTLAVGLGGTQNNTLMLQTSGIDYVDLDGDNELGVVNVSNNVADPLADALTLVIDAPLEDPFGGTLLIGSRDLVEFKQRLLMTNATVQLAGGDHQATLRTGADAAIVSTSTFNISGDVLLDGHYLIGNSNVTVADSAKLTLTGSTWIDRGAFLLNNNSELIVTGNTTITDSGDFNWDGTAGNATTTVRGKGLLTIAVDEVDNSSNDFSGTLNLVDNGKAVVNVTSDAWTISGTLNKTGAGISSITGDGLNIRGALNVSNGTLALPKTTLGTGAVVNIAADGILELGADSSFASPTSVNGAGTLRIAAASSVTSNTTVNVATFDWDGLNEGQRQLVGNEVTFTINAERFDDDGDMDDRIILGGRGAKLIVNGPAEWTMNGIFAAGIGASANSGSSTIGGTSRMVLANRLNVDGLVFVEAPITFGDGSSSVTGVGTRLVVVNEATYRSGNIIGDGMYTPAAVNNVVGTPNISVRHFDFDAGDWNIAPGGHLKVNVANYDLVEPTKAFDRSITLTDGDVTVNSADARFIMNGTLTMISTSAEQSADWEGEPISIGDDNGALDAKLIVGGTHTSRFRTDVMFNGDADVNVAAGAALSFENHVEFNTLSPSGNAEFAGGGKLLFQRTVNFIDPVTLNMIGGVVDLDGDDATGDVITVFAPITIKAAELSDFGRSNAMGGLNVIDVQSDFGFGALTVQLDGPTAHWTLNPEGVLKLTNDRNRQTLLAGSDVTLRGTVQASGDVQLDARVSIEGSINIAMAGEPLALNGGDQGFVPNRIAGGVVAGAGLLGANADRALYGFGTINTAVDFDDTAILRADDGMLTINGPILDVGQIGTEDHDGILNVTNAWNSNVADLVRLKGGELRGAALTVGNAEGLVGFGAVTAKIINNTRIAARSGLLLLETAANDNDWDGAANNGMLLATSGATLELRDNADLAFGGGVSASSGGRVLTNGFAFDFGPTSTLALDNGTFESTRGVNVRGNMTIAGASTMNTIGGELHFKQGSSTNIMGELTLVGGPTVVEAGAAFTGVGALNVSPGSILRPNANANLNVLVDNRGTLLPAGDEAIGRVTLGEFQQSSNANLMLELAGIGLNQFDRLTIEGGALLNGRLSIDLDGGFIPTLGQTFNILTAADGISGMFSNVQLVDMPAGLSFQLNYLPTIVQLKVVSAPILSADFDHDGDVDGDDLTAWKTAFGRNAGGDADGDLDTDGADFLHWQRHFGSSSGVVNLTPPISAVPEPSALVLAFAATAGVGQFHRRRSSR